MNKKNICTICGKDVERCKDRFTAIAYKEDGTPYIYKENVKAVWATGGFKIDPEFVK